MLPFTHWWRYWQTRLPRSRWLAGLVVLPFIFYGVWTHPESEPVGSMAVFQVQTPGSEHVPLSSGALQSLSSVLNEASLPPPPPPPNWEVMMRQGCVADGLLNEYGGRANEVADMLNRSHCRYLHRALETWLAPPDFKQAAKLKQKITQPDMVYGMFLAEAIDTKADYFYPDEDRDFEFAQMCRQGSQGDWGEHTCKPSFASSEYRKYLRFITERAMDMGIQSFLFGQIFYQDDLKDPLAPEIVAEMRTYALSRGMEIIVGAQTNDIDDPEYLRQFDYIEGGVGLHEDGSIEEGACFSRWWQEPGDWCWALLWNERFAQHANRVLLHLDWSGRHGDDMSTFARMDQSTRLTVLQRLHERFHGQNNIGFLMPFLAVLPKDNGGCFGAKERFYIPHRKYSCSDEDGMNHLLQSR